jgi:3-oxoacyl-[acyl-carrier protein] reductase
LPSATSNNYTKGICFGTEIKGTEGPDNRRQQGDRPSLCRSPGCRRRPSVNLRTHDIVIGNVSALAVNDDENAWVAGFNTDMMHCVRLVNAAMPWLEASDAASITLVSSVSGREIDFTGPAYGAFKAALVHYAQGLAYKLAPQGIRANTVSPGNTYFKGGIWESIETGNPELFATALAMNPMGRMATPEEIARGVVFLASPASSFTSGTNLVIDGALTKGIQL